jgi:hypothetical protein
MFEQVLDTLNKLANIANSEAAKHPEKSEMLYARQSQIAALITNIKQIDKHVDTLSEVGNSEASDIANAYLAVMSKLDNTLKPFFEAKITDPELVLAVYHPGIMQPIKDANTALEGLKRNVELKKLSAENLQKEESLVEQGTAEERKQKQIALDAKLEAFGKMCEEDANLAKLIAENKFEAIAESNRKWALFLKEKYQKNDLPEVPTPKAAAPKPSSATQWGKGFFGAITDMFKALNDPTNTDKNGSIMKVLGTLIQLIFGAVGNLFKRFLGNGKEAQDQVEDFTTNASQFFTNLLGSGMATSCQPGKPCAKGASAAKSAPTFTPGFAGAKKAASDLHQPTPAPQQPGIVQSLWNSAKGIFGY